MGTFDTMKTTLAQVFAEDDRIRADFEKWDWKRRQTNPREIVKRSAGNVVHKTVASAKTKGLDFILSDATPDRYNDIIMSDGWNLTSFRKNPIALFSHASSFPIGTWKNVRVEANSLQGTLELAPQGTSDRIDEIRRLVDADVLKAVSVGFSPIEYEERKGDTYGLIYKKQELMECSLVSVPANPNALLVAKRLNISADTQELVFGSRAADRSERERSHRLPALLAGPMDAESSIQWNAWADDKIVSALKVYTEHVHNKLVDDIGIDRKVLIEELLKELDKGLVSWAAGLRKEWRQEILNLKKDLEIAELNKEVAILKRNQKR